MKKILLVLSALSVIFVTGCTRRDKSADFISLLRYDILYSESEKYEIYAFKELRETPLSDDGEKGEMQNLLTFKIVFKTDAVLRSSPVITFSLNGISYRKEFEYKPLSNFVICSFFVPQQPDKKLETEICFDGDTKHYTLLSVINKKTLSHKEILSALKKAEDEDADVFFNGKTSYEIRIRLISSDEYICYYVGLLDKTKSVDFLLDGETGEILAKKK